MTYDTPIWRPDPGLAAKSQLARFAEGLRAGGAAFPSSHDAAEFDAIHRWSIAHPAEFWAAVWRDTGVVADVRPDGSSWDAVVIGAERMAPPDPVLGPRWFRGARLNFAENLLRRDGPDDAIIAWDERGHASSRSWSELRREVGALAAALQSMGINSGDRVAGWLPNIPEAIVAMLATATLGAVWTSCSPDFGVDGIVDRFGQTEPSILFFCDGYRYAGKVIDCTERAGELLRRLPSVKHAIMIDYVHAGQLPDTGGVHRWADLTRATAPIPPFERFPFDHPLYFLYSSGTTGLPKCLVHSAGGTLLQHLKEHRLHVDLRRGDRLFYFTTCGWMMWNWQVSALASDTTLVLYDGAPLPAAEPDVLWRMAAEERVNVFGTSAKYLSLAEKRGLEPARAHELQALRSILSTGSPLAPESFDWIRGQIGASVQPASISGGTDIVSCFMLGNPYSPIYRGEIVGPGLGMAVDVWDESGSSCPPGEAGELVCTRPFPAMPIGFWSDPDGSKYHAAYFETYPGVWRHGYWVMRTVHG
ncbi:MAG: acetoacetate--CoA ligase, partial [Gemmatimonadales bacterium]